MKVKYRSSFGDYRNLGFVIYLEEKRGHHAFDAVQPGYFNTENIRGGYFFVRISYS